ncbi:MAG: AI-2E family transporter [Chitinophagaceae bacterium]|nr:AI-2E family transporter [Chitinophagaceae bacterium]
MISYHSFKRYEYGVARSRNKRLVRANAYSIPLISIIQGLTATLGYFIFGVHEGALWGFLTGVFAFFPVVGTMIVWIPLVIYTFTTGHTGMALGLMLYSIIVTGNVDYLSRITIMKRLGDVPGHYRTGSNYWVRPFGLSD